MQAYILLFVYFLNIFKRSNKSRMLLAVLSVIWLVTQLSNHSQVILDQFLYATNPQFPHLYLRRLGV